MLFVLMSSKMTFLGCLITAHITRKSLTQSNMHCLLVLGEIPFCCCLVVTLSAWVLISFMYCLLVLIYVTLLSCLVFTFPAWVLLSFMHTLSSSLLLTLVAGKHVYFLTVGNQLLKESERNKLFRYCLMIIIFMRENRISLPTF